MFDCLLLLAADGRFTVGPRERRVGLRQRQPIGVSDSSKATPGRNGDYSRGTGSAAQYQCMTRRVYGASRSDAFKIVA
jgi:hypothetical protein